MQILDLSGLYWFSTSFKLARDILCAMILAGVDIINQFWFIFNWQPSQNLIIGPFSGQNKKCKLLRNVNYSGLIISKQFRNKPVFQRKSEDAISGVTKIQSIHRFNHLICMDKKGSTNCPRSSSMGSLCSPFCPDGENRIMLWILAIFVYAQNAKKTGLKF